MSKFIYLVMFNAMPGGDAVLKAWLDKHHLPEVLETEGFRSVQRYELPAEESGNPKAAHRYVHLYEIETDDLARTKAALREGGAKRTPIIPELDVASLFTMFYEARPDWRG